MHALRGVFICKYQSQQIGGEIMIQDDVVQTKLAMVMLFKFI
jgi:hypothetical protein